jgi:glycerol-3-phosphate dehydrogenase (NAD(P)+)
MKKIAVLGDGSWGSVLGSLLADNGNQVTLYGDNPDVAKEINTHHTNEHYMKNWQLNAKAKATTDLSQALADCEIIVFVLPTKAIRSVAKLVHAELAKSGLQPLLVSATKGIEPGSEKLISEILKEEIYPSMMDKIVILSGPSHAENVAQKDLTAITCASTSMDNAEKVQRLFSTDYLRLYTSNDPIGVQVGGAVKNVIALAAGILVGQGYQDDAKAALMTRGLAEMNRLAMAFGGQPWTLSGLSGIGDLIVTCTSTNSRNWRAGYQIGQGKSLDYVLKHMGQVVEGATTVKAIHELCQRNDIEMPICDAVYSVLYQNGSVADEIKAMMNREMKPEVRL